MESFIIAVCCLLFILVITIVFYTKQKIKKLENVAFSRLLILSILGLILQILSYLLIKNFSDFHDSFYYIILLRFIFCDYILWEIFFVYYIIIISFSLNDKENENNKIVKYLFLIGFLILFLILVLPIYITNMNGLYYPTGAAMIFLILGVIYGIFIIFVCVIRNIKHIINIKYLPLLFYIIFGSLAIMWQISNPMLLLVTPIESYILFLMYFTIENPDLKMLEEVTRIKEITEKTNEDKSSFLYHVTDEMNLVLNNVKTKLNNINKMNDISEIKHSLKEIDAIVDNSKKRVNATINISEMDSKELKVINNTYNIVNLLNEIVAYNRNKIKNNIDFRYDISNTIPDMLYGDSIKVKQIINSVIDNSIKNTSEGFIELRVSCIVKYDICRLIISVEDSGTGIDLVKQNKILSDNSELNVNEIKGKDDLIVNLKIVNKLINMIGGTLSMESLNNNGTIVNITLDQKIVQSDGSTLDEKLETYNKYMSDKKIIGVISENKDNVKVIKQIGKKNNYKVESFEMTKTCLDKVRDGEAFDTIVIDEDMDKIDARSFLDKVRKVDSFKGKVFVITKKKNIQLKKELKDYGFDAILIEPLNKKDVEVNFK